MKITSKDICDFLFRREPHFVEKLYLPVLENFFNTLNEVHQSAQIVLDVGCGSGLLLKFNSARSKVGLDLRIPEHRENLGIDFVRGDARHIPFRNEVFCYTIMVRALAYIGNAELALREIKRVTKVNGIIAVSVQSKLSEFLYFVGKAIVLHFRKLKDELRGHKNKFNQKELCAEVLGLPYKTIEFPKISIRFLSFVKGENILIFKNMRR